MTFRVRYRVVIVMKRPLAQFSLDAGGLMIFISSLFRCNTIFLGLPVGNVNARLPAVALVAREYFRNRRDVEQRPGAGPLRRFSAGYVMFCKYNKLCLHGTKPNA